MGVGHVKVVSRPCPKYRISWADRKLAVVRAVAGCGKVKLG